MVDKNNKYTEMQKKYYEAADDNNANSVFHESGRARQNAWPEYEHLFSHFDFELSDKVMLDFGCGPGRNLIFYKDRFERIDGVDISSTLVERAREASPESNVYITNGVDLSEIPSDTYDIVMSTICLQHIAVHEIRYNILKEFLRVLKPDGWITVQMGHSPTGVAGCFVSYYKNHYDAGGTNGMCDVEVVDVQNVADDLTQIGFRNFDYILRPGRAANMSIGHDQALFFRAQK
jgi:SAM-dependent methyltransferase